MADITVKQKHVVAAPKSVVMAGITDPEILRAAIPKCKATRRVSDDKMWVQAEVGFERWSFLLDSMLSIERDPNGFTVSGDVRSPHLRLGQVKSSVVLAEKDGSTTLTSTTVLSPARDHNAVVRKIGETLAKSLSNAFFVKFSEALTSPARG